MPIFSESLNKLWGCDMEKPEKPAKSLIGAAVMAALAAGLAAPRTEAAAPAGEKRTMTVFEVPDWRLAEMRGRFVSGNQVLFFGVEMYTRWMTGSGETYTGGLRLGIDRGRNLFTPTVTIMRIADAQSQRGWRGPEQEISGGEVPPPAINLGGLNEVKGVSQVVQVTGDANSAHNDIEVTVRPYDAPPATNASADNTPGSQTLADGSGATVTTTVANNSIGVTISVPGQGTATQMINGLSGLRQLAQISGDANRVLSTLNMTVGVGALPSAMSVNLGAVLQTIRGLPQAGMY